MRTLTQSLLILVLAATSGLAENTGDVAKGQAYFQQSCSLCHSVASAPGGAPINQQGPGLIGVMNRKAGTVPGFGYTQALQNSGLMWDAPTLDKFLAGPGNLVPGTTMPIAVGNDQDRANLIAYLSTLKAPTGAGAAPAATASAAMPAGTTGGNAPAPGAASDTIPASSAAGAGSVVPSGDWSTAAPGVKHHLTVADLPPPFKSPSAGNPPHVIPPPPDAGVAVPPGFTATVFARGLNNPRLLRFAPNGDLFCAETGANRIHVFHLEPGGDTPATDQVFAKGLDRPFGIAFYPPGSSPAWIYIANNNSVVRIPYREGDMAAQGDPEVIVPKLADSTGGHTTRDIVFSPDGRRLFISVGSGSNIAEEMAHKSVADAQAWEKEHGLGAAWDTEANRADVLVTDPEGKTGLHVFASGIRNGVGLAIDPASGTLWTSTNERDGLGDDLVPDYVTSVRGGGYYGWPWYYMGNHEDPRLAGQRPDLAGKAIVPDVMVQSHSASLQLCFYTPVNGLAAFPAEYNGDIFAAFHGSWNRAMRTGYKVVRIRLKNGVATGEYDDFLTGFVSSNAEVWGRPVGVAEGPDGALYVSEDGNNTIWRVVYSGH